MHSRALHRLLATLVVGLFSLPAVAQFTRDSSANQKIDEAINNHYLMMEFDKSEGLLTGVVQACQDKCSPQTKARAWMYVGLVRGSGKNDQGSAKEAFVAAKGLDSAVKLDRDLASPETQATFDAVPGGTAPPATPTATPAPAAADGEVPGDMVCTPELRDIQTRMPIPVSCSSAAAVVSVELKFKEFGGDKWKKTTMSKVGDQWQAEIPCDVTGTAGPLTWYVGAKDAAGEYVDQYGSKKQPATFTLSDAPGDAPSFPGKPAVERCADKSDCPPDFPGCASASKTCGELDWGAACDNSSQCQCGLLCTNGACENAPSCTSDAECDTGSCVDGKCAAGGGDDGPSGPYATHWLGLDVGYDLVTMGGPDLCQASRDTNYGSQCFDSATGLPFETPDGFADPTRPGTSAAGFAPGQLRIKLGYDFAITENLTIGARVGLGLLNTRPSFVPVSAEARVTYNFTSLASAGLRPFVYVGGGLYETNGYLGSLGVDVYKFNSPPIAITPGLGLMYAINPNMGVKLDVSALLTLAPSVGFGLSPSLGFVYGL